MLAGGRPRGKTMATAIRQSVIVRSGGVIEVRSPELTPGARAEVIVILDDGAPAKRKPLASYVGTGKGTFRTAQEVDEYLRRERDSWE